MSSAHFFKDMRAWFLKNYSKQEINFKLKCFYLQSQIDMRELLPFLEWQKPSTFKRSVSQKKVLLTA